jgi:hypothetical protein
MFEKKKTNQAMLNMFMKILGWNDICYKGCENPYPHTHSISRFYDKRCKNCDKLGLVFQKEIIGSCFDGVIKLGTLFVCCYCYADTSFCKKINFNWNAEE